MIAASPIGPVPTTTTVSPGRTRPLRTPTSNAVGVMSDSINAASSETSSGMACSEVSANGTRTNSAWVPSTRCPRIQPPPPRHCP